jgi:MerR family transcriptional regulator, light-induced transcriptional regulator
MAKVDAFLDASDMGQSHRASAANHLIPLKSASAGYSAPPRDLVARAIASAVIPGLLANGSVVAPQRLRPTAPATPPQPSFPHAQALWSPAAQARHFQPREIERFAILTLDGDADSATDYAHELCAMGVAPTDIMLGLFTPAIRLFGTWWVEDRRSFMDVTVGSIRLQQAMRSMMDHHAPPVVTRPDAPVCMFSVAPLEQHTFGVQVMDNIFRLQGWQMVAPDSHDQADVLAAVAMTHIDVLALATATDGGVQRMGAFIAAARRSAANRQMRILVGGPAVTGRPELARELGADAMADDAEGALAAAAGLLNN